MIFPTSPSGPSGVARTREYVPQRETDPGARAEPQTTGTTSRPR